MIRFLLPLSISLLFTLPPVPLRAGEDTDATPSPVVDIPFVSPGPVADGEPSDAAWSQAATVAAFHPLGEPGRTSGITTVRALYDDEALYLLYDCRGKPGSAVRASVIARDGMIWDRDDEIEFYLFPGVQDTLYIQFAANAIGAKFDTSAPRMNMARDYRWTAAPGWSDRGWVMELRIPLRQFVEGVSSGEAWRVNFARIFRTPADSSVSLTWAPASVSFHETDRFGRIRFTRETSFRESGREVDWKEDERAAMANLRRLRGDAVYEPLRDYLDVITSLSSMHRPFDYLRSRLLEFLQAYPDSSSSLALGLKAVYPMTVGLRLPPEEVEAFAGEITALLRPDGIERDLFELSRGLYYADLGRRPEWVAVYRALSGAAPSVRATAAFFMLSRSRPGRNAPDGEEALLTEALDTFFDLVIRGSTPFHLSEGVGWLVPEPGPDRRGERVYTALRNALRVAPRPVMDRIRSVRGAHLPDDISLALQKTEFELLATRGGPFFSASRADSMILEIAPLDAGYARGRLNMLLRDRIRDCEAAYTAMGTDTLPTVIRDAARLRRRFEGRHPIDMILTMACETVDSLDAAVEALENYLGPRGEQGSSTGPAARYLQELSWRLEHRTDPGYREIPRDAFRFVYRTQGYRGAPDVLDIGSDGRAVLYPRIPDALDPRSVVSPTVPARVDSPAVAFRLSTAEVDSIYSLVTRNDFLSFKLRYIEPCNQCPSTEMTLMTPSFARTVHLQGRNPTRAPFRVADALSGLLGRYLRPLHHLQRDREALVNTYRRWDACNDPRTPPGRRLDLLMQQFDEEPFATTWKTPSWYIDPMRALGRETGREADVEAVIGLKYFGDAFRWTRYARERLPEPGDPDLAAAVSSLTRAAETAARERDAEWYRFLARFAGAYDEDPDGLEEEAEALEGRSNREQARSILLWLACARGDAEGARAIYDRLIGSRAGKRSKFRATLRMALFHLDAARHDEALTLLSRLERDYGKVLSGTREGPILELDDYTRTDLVLDRADLLMQTGRVDEAIDPLRSLREADVPASRLQTYRDILLVADNPEPPASFDGKRIRDYLGAYSAMNRYRLYDEAAAWGLWLLDNAADAKLRSHILGGLRTAFRHRGAWDGLQAEIADRLLEARGFGGGWTGDDPAGEIVDAAIAHGATSDLLGLWRDRLRDAPLSPGRVAPLHRVALALADAGEMDGASEILRRLLSETPRTESSGNLADLLRLRFALDLAGIEAETPGGRERAIVQVDSIAASQSGPDDPIRPQRFIAVARWKAVVEGPEPFAAFVSPHAESLLADERARPRSVFRIPVTPGATLDSPILALRCIAGEAAGERPAATFLDALGIDRRAAGAVLEDLARDPSRLGLDCTQSELTAWIDASFPALLEEYVRRAR